MEDAEVDNEEPLSSQQLVDMILDLPTGSNSLPNLALTITDSQNKQNNQDI